MKRIKLLLLILAVLFVSTNLFGQVHFTSPRIFHKWGSFVAPTCVQYIGDENHDGYDDFLIANTLPNEDGSPSRNAIIDLYHGGSNIDTIPFLSFHCTSGLTDQGPMVGSVDINGDGYRDIVYMPDSGSVVELKVLFGGPQMDTIPDLTIPISEKQFISGTIMNKDGRKIDFDGDGIEELMVYLWLGPINDDRTSISDYYFFKTGPKFTGKYIRMNPPGAFIRKVYCAFNDPLVVDLDGDGCSDILLDSEKFDTSFTHRTTAMTLFYGNADLNFQNAQALDQRDYSAQLFPDLNKDGKGEFFNFNWRKDRTSSQQYYLTYGSNPPDTLPESLNAIYYSESLGNPIRAIGDINGDGYQDAVIGNAFGGPDIMLGGHPPYKFLFPVPLLHSCTMVGRVGDLNGDGCDDILFGDTETLNYHDRIRYGFVDIFKGMRIYMATDETDVAGSSDAVLNAYPNPSNGVVKIRYSLPVDIENLSLNIYDLLGEKIKQLELVNSVGKQEVEIDFQKENVSSGVYIANLTYRCKGEIKNKSVKVQYIK